MNVIHLKDINSKKVIKNDLGWCQKVLNKVCQAKAKHDQTSIEPNLELLEQQFAFERIEHRLKMILEHGVHDRAILDSIPQHGIGNVPLFSE